MDTPLSSTGRPIADRNPSFDTTRETTRHLGSSELIVGLLLAVAIASGMGAVAFFDRDPTTRAEGLFLAFWSCVVLLPLIPLASQRGAPSSLRLLYGGIPPLLVTAGWTFPSGPSRGAAVACLLTSLVVGAAAFVARRPSFDRLVRLFLAIQLLLSGATLLRPQIEPTLLLHWLVWPTIAAWATSVLRRLHGTPRALLAATVTVILGGGFTAAGSLALAAFSSAAWLGARAPARHRAMAGLLLLALLFWDPLRGSLIALGALALAGRWHFLPLATLAAGAALLFTAEPQPWARVFGELAWLPLVLPLVPFSRAQLRGMAAGWIVALIALRTLPEAAEALIVPGLLVALNAPLKGTRSLLLWSWVGALLGACLLLKGYPWLRGEPVAAALDALPVAPGWPLALVLTAALGLAPRLPIERIELRKPVAGLILAAAVGGVLVLTPRTEVFLRWPPAELTRTNPSWEGAIQSTLGELVFDTALANAATLSPGTEVARVRLWKGSESLEWPLRVGHETGEWAARRPDLRHLTAPPGWLHRVDPSGSFFASRYRARWRLGAPVPAERVVVELDPRLPPGTTLTLHYGFWRGPRWFGR